MSLDGIKVVRKHSGLKKESKVDSDFWHVDLKKTKKKSKDSDKFKKNTPFLKEFFFDIKNNLLTKKTILALICSIVLVATISVSVFSYNLVSKNYDFLKLFKSS